MIFNPQTIALKQGENPTTYTPCAIWLREVPVTGIRVKIIRNRAGTLDPCFFALGDMCAGRKRDAGS